MGQGGSFMGQPNGFWEDKLQRLMDGEDVRLSECLDGIDGGDAVGEESAYWGDAHYF